jgi:RecA/RadA recombinase
MTQILHIIGIQGSGKTQLAMQIIAGLQKQGKTARLPQDEGGYTPSEVADIARLRRRPRLPYSSDTSQPDVIILEHEQPPFWLAATLQPGDQVIRIEVAA